MSQSKEKNFAAVVASGVTSLAAVSTSVTVSFVDSTPAVSTVVDAAKAPGYRGSAAVAPAGGVAPAGVSAVAAAAAAGGGLASEPTNVEGPGSPATAAGSPKQQLSPPGGFVGGGEGVVKFGLY